MNKIINILLITLFFYGYTPVYPHSNTIENTQTTLSKLSTTPLLDKAMVGGIEGLAQLLITKKSSLEQKSSESYKTLIIVAAQKESLLENEYNNLLQTGQRAGFDRIYITTHAAIDTTYYLFLPEETKKRIFRDPAYAFETDDSDTYHFFLHDEIKKETPRVSIHTLETDENKNPIKDIAPLMAIIEGYRLKELISPLLTHSKEAIFREISRGWIILPTSFPDNDYMHLFLRQDLSRIGFKNIQIVNISHKLIQRPACLLVEDQAWGVTESYYIGTNPLDEFELISNYIKSILKRNTSNPFGLF